MKYQKRCEGRERKQNELEVPMVEGTVTATLSQRLLSKIIDLKVAATRTMNVMARLYQEDNCRRCAGWVSFALFCLHSNAGSAGG
jgi:hypothetical protein